MGEQKYHFPQRKAERIKTKADICFVPDATASMDPCLEGLKRELYNFVGGLQSEAEVDFRLRLIAYKDLHVDSFKGSPWTMTNFTKDVEEFKRDLAAVVADGGGEYRGAESGLDALFRAIHSEWRTDAHKTILFFTDDDSHPKLHPSTYGLPDNGVDRVIQEFQTLRNALLFMVCPQFPIYKRIEQGMVEADRKIVANFVSTDGDCHIGLRNINFGPLLTLIGRNVSLTSVAMARQRKGGNDGLGARESQSARQTL